MAMASSSTSTTKARKRCRQCVSEGKHTARCERSGARRYVGRTDPPDEDDRLDSPTCARQIAVVHSTGRRNIMNSHVSAGGTDAATKMAGAPERDGPGRAVATMAPGRTIERDHPRP